MEPTPAQRAPGANGGAAKLELDVVQACGMNGAATIERVFRLVGRQRLAWQSLGAVGSISIWPSTGHHGPIPVELRRLGRNGSGQVL